jgi:hypothetical protein
VIRLIDIADAYGPDAYGPDVSENLLSGVRHR